ncbi:MAG TPA: hypothetical protein PKY81_02290 [bacterium]|nr:hypothetical protein [bacterium]HPN29764.1 hypothetical protein [bacterium]
MLKKVLIALMSLLLICSVAFAGEEAAAPAADEQGAVKAAPKNVEEAAPAADDVKKDSKPKFANNVKIVSLEADKLIVKRGFGKKAKEETYVVSAETKYYKDKKSVKTEEIAATFAKDTKINIRYVKDGDKLIAKNVYLFTKGKKTKKSAETPAPTTAPAPAAE